MLRKVFFGHFGQSYTRLKCFQRNSAGKKGRKTFQIIIKPNSL